MGNAYTGFMRALLLMMTVGLGAVLFAAPRQDGMGEPPAAAQEATEANLLDGLKILGEIIRKGPAAEPVKGATAFEKGESPIAIATLVKELTAEAEAQKQFVELYGQLEEAFAAQAKEMKVENDLASAVAFFLVSQYQTVTGKEMDDAAMNAAERTVRAALETQEMKELPDASKQALYETALWYGFLPILMSEGEAPTDEAKQLAGALFERVFGCAPADVTINSRGIKFPE